MRAKQKSLDPRAGIFLIILSVFIVFSQSKIYIEWILMGSLFALMLLFGLKKATAQLLLVYALFTGIQLFVLPNVNVTLASILSLFVYFKMILPCGTAVALFCGTTSVRVLLEAFRRMRLPVSLSIAVAVSVRYFPTLKEDVGAVWNAMRLRGIKGFEQKIEGMYVPILMSAVKTGEDLAASAVCRGVENPAPKTSLTEIKFRALDAAVVLYFIGLTVFCIWVR